MEDTNTTMGFHGTKMVFITMREADQRPMIEDHAIRLEHEIKTFSSFTDKSKRELILRN